MTKVKTLKLAGLLSVEDKDDFIFTIKCATAMIFARTLGKTARKQSKEKWLKAGYQGHK